MAASRKGKSPHWSLLYLVLSVSLVLNTLFVWKAGFSNLYYSAASYSMTKSWSNFFFVSFDPLGYVSVDKPPLGLMIQSLFVRAFGFNTWAIHLPQILASTLSCWILYKIISQSIKDQAAGQWAGLLAAFCLAVTPIFVATARNNTMDAVLILFLLLGCWAVLAASDKGKLGGLILAAVCMGLAFNVKMSQALLALPGMALVYVITPKIKLKKRFTNLSTALAVTVVISVLWMAIVELTPDDNRPFVGSTDNNSAFELAVGHNGVSRLGLNDQQQGPNQPPGADGQQRPPLNQPPDDRPVQSPGDSTNPFLRQGPMKAVNQMVGRQKEGGSTGFLRLLNQEWYGQSSWLLVFAVLSLISTIAVTMIYGEEKLGRAAVLFTAWLLCGWAIFSFSDGIIHTYYLCMMGPPIAACAALGVYAMIKLYREHPVLWLLLPLTLLIGAFEQAAALSQSDFCSWLAVAPLGCGGTAIVLFLARFYPDKGKNFYKNCAVLACCGVMLLNIAPLTWSLTPMLYGDRNPLPEAGPQLRDQQGNRSGYLPEGLVEYLVSGSEGCEILAITPSAISYGSSLIIETGWPVIAAGGFSGGDRYLSTQELRSLVDDKKVRFVILEGDMRQPFYGWVSTRRKVPAGQWYKGGQVTRPLPQIVDLWYPEVRSEQ